MKMKIQLALLLIKGIVQDHRLSGCQTGEAPHTIRDVGGPQGLGPMLWSLDEASPSGSLLRISAIRAGMHGDHGMIPLVSLPQTGYYPERSALARWIGLPPP